jgi:hypothetical protein
MGRHSVGHMQTIQPQLSRVLDHRFRVMLAAIHQLPVQLQFAVSDFNLHADGRDRAERAADRYAPI